MDNSFFVEISGWKVLIDPWLEGTEVDFFPWFNTQWHRMTPLPYDQIPSFDTVLITQKYPDHFHSETLLKLDPKHVIAPKSIEKKLKKMLPDASVTPLNSGNNKTIVNNVEVTFFPSKRKVDPIYDAFLLDDGKESIFVATHGFDANEQDVKRLKTASPCRLLMTPFNRYALPFFLGGIVAPGLEAVKALCTVLNPKTVVATHDEDKHAKGLVSKFAKITRAPSTESLLKLPWLAGRYLAMDDYQQIQIS